MDLKWHFTLSPILGLSSGALGYLLLAQEHAHPSFHKPALLNLVILNSSVVTVTWLVCVLGVGLLLRRTSNFNAHKLPWYYLAVPILPSLYWGVIVNFQYVE
ncbi:MAG: hypothetical protein ACFCU3_05030 [Verrucomicrobiales bacterium]